MILLRVLVLSLVLSLVLAAPSLADPDDPFRAERLSGADARVLQAALAFGGHYRGLLDGAWGRGSAAALRAAAGTEPTERDALAALVPLLDDEAVGWTALNPRGTSMLLPVGILQQESDDGTYLSHATASRDLIVRVLFSPGARAGAMHRWLAANAVGDPYRADTRAAFVTKGRLPDGDTVYLRTIVLDGALHETVLVQWAPRQAARGRVVVASLSNGWVPDLEIRPDGYLARMAAGLATAPPPEAAASSGAPGAVRGTGTGFYVNATDLVTAAHVVDGCSAVTAADGTALRVIAASAPLDLAALRRESGWSAHWFEIAPDGYAALGGRVTALGFPLVGLFSQGLTVTTGNVSALRGLGGEAHAILFTAPIQPGNSGGPLIDGEGRVVGVVTAKADELYVAARGAGLPQNMNVATRGEALVGFLARHGVHAKPAADDADERAEGITLRQTRATIQLRCH